MNVLNKVTLQSLKKNKARTIVTIIGVMLSVSLICAATTFCYSMKNYTHNLIIHEFGNWHGSITTTEFQKYNDISSSNKVSKASYAQVLGYSKFDSKNPHKPYIYIMGGNMDKYCQMFTVDLISGHLPQNSNEIILPENFFSDGNVNYSIGDTIKLDIGNKISNEVPNIPSDDEVSNIYETLLPFSLTKNETVEIKETRTYTVVGTYKQPSWESSTTTAYTALTAPDKEFTNETVFKVYFKVNNGVNIEKFQKEINLDNVELNGLLLHIEKIPPYTEFTNMLIKLALIVIGIIMIGSIFLIYNAFAISVSDRTKQFGLLSSIGATKKQLRKTVLFEASSVSAIGIPLGIIVGISGIWITLLLIGDKFSSLFGNYNVPMKVCISWEAIAIAIIFSLITIFISAWIPSIRINKISAMEAIRQNMDIKTKNKLNKTSKLTYKLFGLPGVIASKHYKRSKRKYRTTVISLFISTVLFISASAFADYLFETTNNKISSLKYDLSLSIFNKDMNGKSPSEILKLLLSDKYVTDGAYVTSTKFDTSISNKYFTKGFLNLCDDQSDKSTKNIHCYMYFVNDAAFKKLLAKYNLKESDYFNHEQPLGIVLDSQHQYNPKTQKYEELNILKKGKCDITRFVPKKIEGYKYMYEKSKDDGILYCFYQNNNDKTDILEIPSSEAYTNLTLKLGKTITEAPFYIPDYSPIATIYPESSLEYFRSKQAMSSINKFDSIKFYLTSDKHATSYKNLDTILKTNDIPSDYLSDSSASTEKINNILTIIKVFSYGFIILISLIAATNVFNTISTNLNLRRKEFAMLKSVGMAQKDFDKMMNYECILYGSKALIFGLPVSSFITYFIYKVVNYSYETTYHLPLKAIGIATLSIFAVVFSTMLYSMNKIKKDNPIDALKNENL